MILNKFVTYLYYVGCVVLGIGVVGKLLTQLLIYLPLEHMIHKNVLIYMMGIGMLMMVPLWIYKLCHFNEYKKENKDRLITFAMVVVGVLLLFLIKKHV